MKLIDETDQLRLEHEYEKAYLIHKPSKSILIEEEFYGEPTCGLIDKENNWVIIAGDHLTIWSNQNGILINAEKLRWIHSIRVKNSEIVEVLTDPWSEDAAIWELNTTTFVCRKVGDFKDYSNQEYTEDVIW